ncbi:MAG: response regulator [Peptostreptococcaceae bacterium]|nr:response regulator [Peptostreptococcaceae bacterium]
MSNYVSCIVSDIEMPLMDGHRLTKLIKSDDELKHIPVILFSSLISDELRIKGQEVGADEQITKPEIVELVNIIDRLIK